MSSSQGTADGAKPGDVADSTDQVPGPGQPDQSRAPVLTVVGSAGPDEVAAVVAVLSGLGGSADAGDSEGAGPHTSPWSAPAERMRGRRAHTPTAGPHAWQYSLR